MYVRARPGKEQEEGRSQKARQDAGLRDQAKPARKRMWMSQYVDVCGWGWVGGTGHGP